MEIIKKILLTNMQSFSEHSFQDLITNHQIDDFETEDINKFAEKLDKYQLIADYISEKIKYYWLTIADFKFENGEESVEEYWQDIKTKIELEIIRNLSKNNSFLPKQYQKVLIFNSDFLDFSESFSLANYDSENHNFKIRGNYLSKEVITYFNFKMTNFNEQDILNYFYQKINLKKHFNFYLNDFNFNNFYFWKQQILEKLRIDDQKIIINNQEIDYDYDLLNISWLDMSKIKQNRITFGLNYGKALITVSIATLYFLENIEKNLIFLKKNVEEFIDENPNVFDEFHPFKVSSIAINQKLFTFLKKTMRFQDFDLAIFIEDFSLKLPNSTVFVNPFQKWVEVDLYFKNLFVEKLKYNFPNYFIDYDLMIISDIIDNNCLLDLANIDLDLVKDELQKNQIIQQIYQQIAELKIEINDHFYKIKEIYRQNNFQIISVFLFGKSIENNKLYIVLKVIYDDEQWHFLQCGIKYEQINDNNLQKKWNEVFQKAYITNKSFEKNINCKDISACRDIKDKWEAEVIINTSFVFEKWKNIIGRRKVFLEDFETINHDYFEVVSATLHHFVIDDNDQNNQLNLHALLIKEYFHINSQKFNSVMLSLKIKQEFLVFYPKWTNMNFQFIFPLLIVESEQ